MYLLLTWGFQLFDSLTYTTVKMIPFQDRKRIRKILYSKSALLVLTFLLLIAGNGVWNIYQKYKTATIERDIAHRALTDIETRTELLKASLAHLGTERGIEDEVRQKYTVAKKGEEVVVVVDDSAKKSENSDAMDDSDLWQKIVSFFKK